MRWSLPGLLVLACFLLGLGHSTATGQDQERALGKVRAETIDAVGNYYRRVHLVCIGINDYASPHVPDLSYAENDARLVASTLTSLFSGLKVPVSPRVLLGRQATQAGIRAALEELTTAEVDPRDAVFFYFAGHGVTGRIRKTLGERGYFVPQDAPLTAMTGQEDATSYERSCVGMLEVVAVRGRIPARHVVFLADACYSGLMAGERALPALPAAIQQDLAVSAAFILTAGSKSETVLELSDLGHGAFTYNLVDGIRRGTADLDGDGFIRMTELGAFAQRLNLAAQTPQLKRFAGSGDPVLVSPLGRTKPEAPPVALLPQQAKEMDLVRGLAKAPWFEVRVLVPLGLGAFFAVVALLLLLLRKRGRQVAFVCCLAALVGVGDGIVAAVRMHQDPARGVVQLSRRSYQYAPPSGPLAEAMALITGSGGGQDFQQAAILLEGQAQADPRARLWLAYMHLKGLGGYDRDATKAGALAEGALGPCARRAAEGDVDALVAYAQALYWGLGSPRNPWLAADLIRQAAIAEHPYAQAFHAALLAEGRVIPADPRRARESFRLAVEKDVVFALIGLSRMLLAGDGGDPDFVEAYRLLDRAARLGSAEANARLSLLLRDGIGCAPNRERASEAMKVALWTHRDLAQAVEKDPLDNHWP